MAGLVPAIPIRDLEALPTKAICHGAKPGISARVVGAYETSDMQAFEELFELAKRLSGAAASGDAEAITLPLEALNKSANEVKRSFSGSWLGYHSRVYYEGLLPAPPGANFSQEWGLKDMHITSLGSRGDWLEYDYEEVKAHIFEIANNPDLGSARDGAGKAAVEFDHAKSEIISILDNELDDREDSFLAKLKADLENIEPLSKAEVAQRWSPKGQIMTRDMIAMGQGAKVPPHIDVLADIASIRHSFSICKAAADISTKAASHLERKSRKKWLLAGLARMSSLGMADPLLGAN